MMEKLAQRKVSATRWLWLGCVGGRSRVIASGAVFRLGYGLVELLLKLFFRVEQVAECELQLARLAALGLVAVEAPKSAR
jgi:hypothetical protein